MPKSQKYKILSFFGGTPPLSMALGPTEGQSCKSRPVNAISRQSVPGSVLKLSLTNIFIILSNDLHFLNL